MPKKPAFDLFASLKAAGERVSAFSLPPEGQKQTQRMQVSLCRAGVEIIIMFAEPDGIGQTEFMLGWTELEYANADVIDLGINKCVEAMEEILAEKRAASAAEPQEPEAPGNAA